jgi:uncharacterized protein (DUF983 family)
MNVSLIDNPYVNKNVSITSEYKYEPTDTLISVFGVTIGGIIIMCCIIGFMYSYRKPRLPHIVVISPAVSTINPIYRIENDNQV